MLRPGLELPGGAGDPGSLRHIESKVERGMPVLGNGRGARRLEVADQQVAALVVDQDAQPSRSQRGRECNLRHEADSVPGSSATAVGLP